MLTKKEITWIIITILIFGFVIGWSQQPSYSPFVFLIATIILLTNIFAKKIAANHFNIKIEHEIWKFKQYYWPKRSKFKKPIPIGLILPFFFSFLSLGAFKIFTLLQFNAKNLHKKRALRKRGANRYSEINESDLAFTSAWGFWSLIFLAILAIIIKQPEIAKYSIYYGFWNLIPISNLDGTKLFFGSLINWMILAVIYAISLIVVLII